jgi:hypothetical protein
MNLSVPKAKTGNKTKNKRLLAHGSDEMSAEENPSRKNQSGGSQ